MTRTHGRTAVFAAVGALTAALAAAQTAPQLTFPRASQMASVTQRVGLTDITISYSRPSVRERAIWGDLVPYGQVWRAGANENTTISFSTPVTIAGAELSAGAYGLHMIPQEGSWIVILSHVSTAWGSFDYDPANDALRFDATPEPAPFQEVLTFSLDDPGPRSATAALRWEKLRLPFLIEVDTPSVVMASLRDQLHGLHQFFWQSWNQAAAYATANSASLDLAEAWAEKSIAINRNFTNVATLSRIAAARGDADKARTLIDEALPIATEVELNAYGYQLLGAGDTVGALDMFRLNVERHPESWNVHDSLGEGYAAVGNTAEAVRCYSQALSMAPEAQRQRIEGLIAGLSEKK